MADFFCYVMANGVLASMLAVAVWCVGRFTKRPAVLHVMWVLVLLRLVVPPVLVVDLTGVKAWMAQVTRQSSNSQAAMVRKATDTQLFIALSRAATKQGVVPIRSLVSSSEESESETGYRPVGSILASGRSVLEDTALTIGLIYRSSFSMLFAIWFVGSFACLCVQLRSVYLFNRSLKQNSYRSRFWQVKTEKIARRMGLTHCPQSHLMRAQISPMLWGLGPRCRIVFPDKLLEVLSVREQNTLLAHELAHYRRGDQWVRLLEMAATTLFWWHPVLWWARQEIERYEEQCCDAWAVRISNGCRRTYANALLSAVDFVSSVLPPVASGASHTGFLRQRLTAIMIERPHNRNTLLPGSYPGLLAMSVMLLIPCPAFWSDTPTTKSLPSRAGAVATVAKSLKSDSQDVERFENTAVLPPASPAARLTIDDARRAHLVAADGSVRKFEVGRVSSACYSREGDMLAVGTASGTVELIDAQTGRTIRENRIGYSAVSSVAISPDREVLAAGTTDGNCTLFELNEKRNKPLLSRNRRGEKIRSVRFANDGRHVAVVWGQRNRSRVEVWDINTGRVSGRLSIGDNDISRSATPVSSVAAVIAPTAQDTGALGTQAETSNWHVVFENGDVHAWDGGDLATGDSTVLATIPADKLEQLRIQTTHAR